jgi:hypothetical protein
MLMTYVLISALVILGLYQARTLIRATMTRMTNRADRAQVDDENENQPAVARTNVWDLLGTTTTTIGQVLKVTVAGAFLFLAVGAIGLVFLSMSSCTQSITECIANRGSSYSEKENLNAPAPAQPIIGGGDISNWLDAAELELGDNGWKRVETSGVHKSKGKYGCEFVANCSLLNNCRIKLSSTVSGGGKSMHNGKSWLLNQDKRVIERLIENNEDTSVEQYMNVRSAEVLYLSRRLSSGDPYLDADMQFTWSLAGTNSQDTVRRAFKRDFSLKDKDSESCDFAVLPFQLPSTDGNPVRTQFDLSITLTKLLSDKAELTVDTPKLSTELLQDSPTVLKMVSMDDDKKGETIFRYLVTESSGQISSDSEKFRDRWSHPDKYKLGKIIIEVNQPLTVHIAYRVGGSKR